MQLQDFTYVLQHPESITSEQTDAIKKTVNNYPYFQAARALHLKGLKNKESFKYNNALKVTAAYTTDRSVLFDYITSEQFNQNEISQLIKQNSQYIKDITVNDVDDISVDKRVTIDKDFEQQVEDTEGVLDPDLFQEKTPIITDSATMKTPSIITIDVDNITPESKLEIGKPLEFDKTDTHSFAEWLKITSFEPIKRSEDQGDQNDIAPLDKKMTLIDKFINENPKIKPTLNTPKPKLIDDENSVEDNLMTETLARIYLEQKNYEKAIQSYKILSLKYPEKSSFFADQIKAIKELKEHNNTK